MSIFKNLSVGKKMVFSGVTTTALLAVILAGLALWQSDQAQQIAADEVQKLANREQEGILAGVVATLASQQELLEEKVVHDLNVARDVLQQIGVVGFSTEMVEWSAVNQLSKAGSTVSLPKMMAGETWLGQNAETAQPSIAVDQVRTLVGGTCTIFQRMNEQGDMLRVSTNVATLENKRAIGTYIPVTNPDGQSSPILQKVLAGERFVGRAFVVNKWYVTAYEPIYDQEKKVVGMLYVGVAEESAKSLRRQIMDIKVGETGFVFVLDPKGQYVISQKGEHDGENVWEAKDAQGDLFIQEIVKRGQALKPGEFSKFQYYLLSPGGPQPRQKTVNIAYFGPWQWIIGAGTWEEEIQRGVTIIHNSNKVSRNLMLGVSAAALVLIAGLWILLARSIVSPIRRAADMLKDISEGEGDLTRRLEVKSRDEVGRLAYYFNNFVGKLQEIITSIAGNVESLAATSTDLATVSRSLTTSAKEAADTSDSVAAASEEMSANFQSVAAAMEQSTSNVNMIASSTEEMTATVGEIAENAAKARGIADTAVKQSQLASTKMANLGQSATKIGRVTEAITEISEQTNLLALNATIEAARAGEAGKGFAVVANEIKELAKQTASATVDIKNQISEMQTTTTTTVADIEKISEVIVEISNVINVIATAVEEQSAATGEIAGNIAQASQGIAEVNENVAQSTMVATDITRDVSGISTRARQVGEGSAQVQTSAQSLSDLSGQLELLVKKFKI